MTANLKPFRRFALCIAAILVLGGISASTVVAQNSTPTISSILNAASYGSGSVAPGEAIAILGAGLGPDTPIFAVPDSSGVIPSALGDTTVYFDGTPVPVLSASATKVIALVPYGVSVQATTSLQVGYQGVISDAVTLQIVPASPGLYTSDDSGIGQAKILNVADPLSNPAPMGSTITILITGVGLTDPPSIDGQIASGSPPPLILPVSVVIGDSTASVSNFSAAPGFAGVFQISIVVPQDLTAFGQVPIVVTVGNVATQSGVTVAIGQRPAPPTAVQAAATSPTQISLTWVNVASPLSNTHIERRADADPAYLEIAVVDSSAISYQDPSVASSTTYLYRLRAESSYGLSDYSPEIRVGTPAVLYAPTNLAAAAVSATQINLTWTNITTTGTVRIERKTGTGGTYGQINSANANVTLYQDAGLSPGTSYFYRVRVAVGSSVSPYSNEATATTPAQLPPAALSLQATVLGSALIRLDWVTTVSGIVGFHVERRDAFHQYAEISQLGPTWNLFLDSGDTGLIPATTYTYRVRAQTGVGFSPYSNEVTATTAPVTISITSSSPLPNATVGIPYSFTFTAVGGVPPYGWGAASPVPGLTLTGTGVLSGTPTSASTYSFPVVVAGQGNQTVAKQFTLTVNQASLPVTTTVFLVHGLGESSADSYKLGQTLLDPVLGITAPATIDWGFTWPCATISISQCSSACTIPQGANSLAAYIISKSPPGGRIVLIGHSMGGLLARDMILNNTGGVLTTRTISALVTLGTPNVGYPFVEGLDDVPVTQGLLNTAVCPLLGQEMWSDYRTQQAANVVIESNYLASLNQQWGSSRLPGQFSKWLAAAGTFCKDPTRSIFNPVGCPDGYPSSDGVVCERSASFALNVPTNKPSQYFSSDFYAHTTGMARYQSGKTLLCTTQAFFNNYIPLFDPPASSSLVQAIKDLINGL